MRVVELFAGVGGFRLGLERVGHAVVWSNEWDKYAADTYDKNFFKPAPGVDSFPIDRRDLTTIPATDIPSHDLICGGFPCQAFSVAGKRRGFAETRGTLFFEILRLARHHRTPYLFLENVKGLLSHDSGRTFETILAALDESGYDCQWQVLNSKDFGVPQNRERVIIVGHLRGQPRPQVFPLAQDGGLLIPTRGKTQPQTQISNALRAHGSGGRGDVEDSYVIANTLTSSDGGPDANDTYAVAFRGRKDGVVAEMRADKIANSLRTAGGGSSKPMIGYPGHTPSHASGIAKTVKAGVHGVPGGEGLLDEGYRIRRLTPVECERLQGFPDNWTQGVSDTQRYKQMGNAVTVNVIEAIARRLLTVQV